MNVLLHPDVDVVVVGFGLPGAEAALEAAGAGARVLALTRGPADGDRQAAACAAGVEVRRGTVAELVVEGGRVTGAGFLVDEPTVAVGRPEGAGADRLWPAEEQRLWSAGSIVDGVTCSSVVLALDAEHWDFVGPAVWSLVRTFAADQRTPDARGSSRLSLVGPDHALPEPVAEPELAVRRWCAEQEAGSAAAANQRPLQVEETTGLVMTGENVPVPGLYSAVPACSGASAELDVPSTVAAARRAGRAAALRPRAGQAVLRSVG